MAKEASWFDNLSGGDFHEASSPGLAENPKGVFFRCGTCGYYSNGKCTNTHPKLNRAVGADWCCNLYEHEGMKKIV